MFNFPWSNFHELNLDWILKVVKKAEDIYTTGDKNIDYAVRTAEEAKTIAEQAAQAQVADNSVSTPKIVDGAVTTAKLADSSVTTGKIADNAVTLAKLDPLIRETLDDLNDRDKRNFILIGDSFSIGYTTVDGANYYQTDWGWANKTKAVLEALGHNVYTSNDSTVFIPGVSGFNGTLPFLTMLQAIEQSVTIDKDTITDIVVLGGTNDINYTSGLSQAIEDFVTYVHTNYPYALVKVGVLGTNLKTLTQTIVPYYRHVADLGCVFISDTTNMMPNNDYICVDGTHLTTDGYRFYFPYIFNAVITGHTSYNFIYGVNLSATGQNVSSDTFSLLCRAKPDEVFVGIEAVGSGNKILFSAIPTAGAVFTTTSRIRVPDYNVKFSCAPYYGQDSNQRSYCCGNIYLYISDEHTVSIIRDWPFMSVSGLSNYWAIPFRYCPDYN